MSYTGFNKLKAMLGKQKGVTNPGGLAAAIGRKKMGKERFQDAASKGLKEPAYDKKYGK